MDRQVTHTNALIPNATLLGGEKAKLVALGYALELILGAGPNVGGLVCTPTIPASNSIVVGPGVIMAKAAIDPSSAFGDLGTDAKATVKQGILQDPGVTLAISPPTTAGYTQVFLIQAAQADQDSGTVLPYYNPANPSQPFNGPDNSGNADVTLRASVAVVQVIPGVAAPSGTQVAPTPTPGFTPLYLIAVPNGTSGITSNMIARAPGAPFIPEKLPKIPAAIQNNKYTYVKDAGVVNALAVSPDPAFTAYQEGQELTVVPLYTSTSRTVTLAASGLAAASVLLQGGGQPAPGDLIQNQPQRLRQDAAGNWRFTTPAQSEVNPAPALGWPSAMRALTTSNTAVTLSVADVVLGSGGTATKRVQGIAGTIDLTKTGLGGLDAGPVGANAAYDFFAVANPSTGVAGFVAAVEGSLPTALIGAGFTFYRRLSWGRTNGAGQWWYVRQLDNEIEVEVVAGTSPGGMPLLVNNVQGDPTTSPPTYVTVPLTGLVSKLATHVDVVFSGTSANNNLGIAGPTSAYGNTLSTTNPAYSSLAAYGGNGRQRIMLHTSVGGAPSIAWAGQANSELFLGGFRLAF